ncbi:hypothetical protein GGS23DRAFT_483223 [Durotheca rogersii]|uniref:uncharacterized protein n=1 Tax=Durotheca rogersii TaxID=419775 RepID=UPI00222027A3|nr:uncharacterized protein GGS23DRAFT_483223 [Durotheca rogersii]KAI5864119.1 hypothetical protein GGS23DRAFT_483223 [Durotheca rogersii]
MGHANAAEMADSRKWSEGGGLVPGRSIGLLTLCFFSLATAQPQTLDSAPSRLLWYDELMQRRAWGDNGFLSFGSAATIGRLWSREGGEMDASI